MLFLGTYDFRPEIANGTGLRRFQPWTPPAGFVFKGHWVRGDVSGGVFVAEAESAAAIFEAASAFADLIDFEIVPALDIIESLPITGKVNAWIESVT